jgi:hypothetical protein
MHFRDAMRSPDVVLCLAARRWSCYYERSQHLMSACARERRAVFVEEPELDTVAPDVELSETRTGVITVIPHLPPGLTQEQTERAQRRVINFVLAQYDCLQPVLWYYDADAIGFTDHVDAAATVFDWLETGPTIIEGSGLLIEGSGLLVEGSGLIANDGAPRLGQRAAQLLDRADVVFTDVPSNFGFPDHRQILHHNIHAYSGEPSWIATWRSMWSHVDSAILTRGYSQVPQSASSAP